jgi:hypothetical protein
MMRDLIVAIMLMVGSVYSHAEELEPATAMNDGKSSDESREQGATSTTRAWLDFQRSGQAASDQPQPVSGEAMGKIHERYINSFGNPIPEFYDHAVPVK